MREVRLFIHKTPKSNKIIATADYLGNFTRSDNKIKVLKGSYISKNDSTNKPQTVRARKNIISLHVEDYNDEYYILIDNYVFNSPALAVGVILGKEIGGLKMVKDKNGKDFTEIRNL